MINKVLKNIIQKRLLLIGLSIVWTIVIFVGCSLPGKDLPELSIFDHFDKVVHFSFFMVFFFLWYFSFNSKKNAGIYLVIMSFIYGFGLEFYQVYFVAGRSFDIWDGVADTLGSVFGLGLIKCSKLKSALVHLL